MKKQKIIERIHKKLIRISNVLGFIIWRLKTRQKGLDRW